MLQDRRQKHLAIPRREAVPPAVMHVDVAAVEYRIARRRANRRRTVEISKAHAVFGHAVEHRSLANRMPRATEQIPPHLVRHDHEHVRRPGRRPTLLATGQVLPPSPLPVCSLTFKLLDGAHVLYLRGPHITAGICKSTACCTQSESKPNQYVSSSCRPTAASAAPPNGAC